MTDDICDACERGGRVPIDLGGMETKDLEALVHQLYEFTLQNLPDGAATEMERLADAGLAELQRRRRSSLSGLKVGDSLLIDAGEGALVAAEVVKVDADRGRVKVLPKSRDGPKEKGP